MYDNGTMKTLKKDHTMGVNTWNINYIGDKCYNFFHPPSNSNNNSGSTPTGPGGGSSGGGGGNVVGPGGVNGGLI